MTVSHADAAAPVSRSGGLLLRFAARSGRIRPLRLLSAFLLLGVWELVSATGAVPAHDLPPPATVADAGWQLARNGQLADALVASLERVGLGLGLGLGIGIALALVSGMSRRGDDLVDPSMQMLRTLPVLALVPLFILWFGIGQTSKVYMIAFACIFPVYLNLSSGIRGVDAKLLEAARTLRLSRLQLIRHVIVPGSAASLLVGLRYATGVAWLVLVISEQINASSGVGYLMVNAQEFFRTDIVLVGVVIYALLGFLTDALCRLLERHALAWRGDVHRR